MDSSPEAQVRQVIKEINETWSKGCPEDLGKFFHQEMVILHPNGTRLGEGRDACVRSYVDFCKQARVLAYRELDHAIDLFGDTAVACYGYEITFEMKGETITDRGRDLFVFLRRDSRWLAAWRTLIALPPQG